MKYYSHANPDGYLYCVKEDAVRHGVLLDCFRCPFYRSSLQGLGRECVVTDEEEVIEIKDPYAYVEAKQVGDVE